MPNLGSCALAWRVRLPPGCTLLAETFRESMMGTAFSKGAGSTRRPVAFSPTAPSAGPPPPSAPTPAPAPTAAPTPVPAAPADEIPTVEAGDATETGGGFALPFTRVRGASLGELRQELGFGLLVAAFSVGFAAILRARRPFRPGAPGGEELLWDVRLARSVARALRGLAGFRP